MFLTIRVGQGMYQECGDRSIFDFDLNEIDSKNIFKM